jgi:hypothetical protein
MNRKNSSKTMLWPRPEAWSSFRLSDYLPNRAIDTVDKRTKALRVLALYRWARVGRLCVSGRSRVLCRRSSGPSLRCFRLSINRS